MKITTLSSVVLLGVLGIVALALPANAQGLPLIGNPTTVAAGLFVPEGGASKYGGATSFMLKRVMVSLSTFR